MLKQAGRQHAMRWKVGEGLSAQPRNVQSDSSMNPVTETGIGQLKIIPNSGILLLKPARAGNQ